MRGIVITVGLSVILVANWGCKQQCFMTADDLDHYKTIGVASLEFSPGPSITPATTTIGAPATVFDADRQIRYVTLAECIATTLERGTTGVQSPFFPGAINDLLASFGGSGITGSDNIRVLALQPAITGTNIDSALSKFDARWINSANWATSDQPVANALQTVQAAALSTQSSQPVIAQDTASVSSTLLKPLPSGGVAGITFNTAYQLSNLRQAVNPNYTPNLVFSFEQPLLQSFGTEINQLRATHPGSILNPFPTALNANNGILISRVRFDEARAEFERNINFTLVNVEIAYWNLYGTYWTLYSREQALKQAYEAWKINKFRFEAGRVAIQDLAQSRQQYELFRGQRLTALGDALEKERQLRGFMALPMEDGFRLVPIDAPTLAPYHPDWHQAANEALALRPELILARNEVKIAQMQLIVQKNTLLPDLRFISQYGYTGIGNQLQGGIPGNAFRSLASGDFVNWNVGLQTTIPLGFRDANAGTRAARLNLQQNYQVLLDQERKAMQYLTFQYRQIFLAYEQIKIQRAQREAAAIQLDARFRLYIAGSKESTLDILLEAQRVWADALQAEYANIVTYNNALAGFEFAKGTIMTRNNVVIAEGPLPMCAKVRAVEHERERAKAILAREHPRAAPSMTYSAGGFVLPTVPEDQAPALPGVGLPELLKDKQPLPPVPQASITPASMNSAPTASSSSTPGYAPISLPPTTSSP